MPAINRTTIIQGPCLVTYDSQTMWSKGDVTLTPKFDTFAVETSAWGQVDTRLRAKSYEITFEPDGRITAGLIAVLWPWAATAVGASVFGATDKALVIHGRDGVKATIHNAAVTRMPSIRVSAGATVAGAVTFTALVANSTDPTAATAYLTVATQAYPAETGWTAADILTNPPGAAWGAAPWDVFQVADPGWEISPALSLSPVSVDGLGVVDMKLQSLRVTARAVPVGVTAAHIVAAMNGTGALGSSMGSGTELVVTSGTTPKLLTVTCYNAAMTESSLVWGAANKRVAQCTWEACRTVTAGAADPLFTIALS